MKKLIIICLLACMVTDSFCAKSNLVYKMSLYASLGKNRLRDVRKFHTGTGVVSISDKNIVINGEGLYSRYNIIDVEIQDSMTKYTVCKNSDNRYYILCIDLKKKIKKGYGAIYIYDVKRKKFINVIGIY